MNTPITKVWHYAVGITVIIFGLVSCTAQGSSNGTSSTQPSAVTATTIAAQPSISKPVDAKDTELVSIVDAVGLDGIQGNPPLIDFELEDLSGKKVKLSDLKGKVVLLNFWATWCPPCRQEMPSMEKLYQTFKDDKDFVMLAVDAQEPTETVKQFIAKNPYNFRILLDTTGKVDSEYGITGIPTTYMIDRSGRVVAGKSGAHQWDNPRVIAGIRKMLAL